MVGDVVIHPRLSQRARELILDLAEDYDPSHVMKCRKCGGTSDPAEDLADSEIRHESSCQVAQVSSLLSSCEEEGDALRAGALRDAAGWLRVRAEAWRRLRPGDGRLESEARNLDLEANALDWLSRGRNAGAAIRLLVDVIGVEEIPDKALRATEVLMEDHSRE